MQKPSINLLVPNVISRLRLCSALSDCGTLGVENGLKQSEAQSLFVFDDNQLGHTDWAENAPADEAKCFKALNPNSRLVVLLPLDGCIITGHAITAGGIADSALLTEKEMSFIEFKTNVTTPNPQTIQQRTDEAVAQLWHTYSIIAPRCQNKGITLSDKVTIDFYIIFDKNLDVTSASASRQSLMAEFLEQHKFPLFFDNEKEFG